MVTTQLDFMHFRTTTALAGHVKWVARGINWFNVERKYEKTFKAFEKGDNEGSIEKTEESFNRQMKYGDKEENAFYTILKDELILLNEEQKINVKEEELDQQLAKAVANLNKNEREDFRQKIEGPLLRVRKAFSIATDRIRRTLNALRGDEQAFVEMQNLKATLGEKLLGKKSSLRVIARDAKKEKRDIKKEALIDKLYHDFNQFQVLIAANKSGEAENKLKEILNTDAKVFKAMEDELRYVTDIITRDAMLYVEFVKSMGTINNELRELTTTGFPEKTLNELKKKDEDLYNRLVKHREDLYRLARYENQGARAAS